MLLTDNNAVQLWRKAEADTRDALNLMLMPETSDCVFKILTKLRVATAAIAELDRRAGIKKYAHLSPGQLLDARLDEIGEGHHSKCECPVCRRTNP
jgi:hypothetical protein